MSRNLKYHNPYPLAGTKIHKGESLNMPTADHYERFCTVFTKNGIVTVIDFEWPNNFGVDRWVEFQTVLDGEVWAASLNGECRLSDISLKWMATYFMNQCIKAFNGEIVLK